MHCFTVSMKKLPNITSSLGPICLPFKTVSVYSLSDTRASSKEQA